MSIERISFLEARSKVLDAFKDFSERFPVITFDVDGVLADSAAVVAEEASKRFAEKGLILDPNEITSWGYLQDTAVEKGLSFAEANQVENLWFDPNILRKSLPINGSISFLRRIFEIHKGKVFVVTSRKPNSKEATLSWFSQYAPFFPSENIFIRESTEISGEEFKLNLVEKLRSSIHFEDSEKQVEIFLKRCPQLKIVYLPYAKTPNNFGNHPNLIFIKRKYTRSMWEIYNSVVKRII